MMVETARRIEDRERRRDRGAERSVRLTRPVPGIRAGPSARVIVGEFDGAVVPSRDGAHKAEPEPVSRGAAARLEADEAVEYRLAIRFWDARPAIGDFDRRPARRSRCTRICNFAAAGIFQRVVEQVGERLRQQMRGRRES